MKRSLTFEPSRLFGCLPSFTAAAAVDWPVGMHARFCLAPAPPILKTLFIEREIAALIHNNIDPARRAAYFALPCVLYLSLDQRDIVTASIIYGCLSTGDQLGGASDLPTRRWHLQHAVCTNLRPASSHLMGSGRVTRLFNIWKH